MLLLPWLVLVYGKSSLVRYSAPVHMCHIVIGPKCSTVLLLSFPSSIFLLIHLLLLLFFLFFFFFFLLFFFFFVFFFSFFLFFCSVFDFVHHLCLIYHNFF